MWSDLRTVRPCFRGQWGWWEWRCAGEQCIILILKKLQHYFWQIRICMSIIFRFSVFSSGGLILHYHYDRVSKLKYDIYKIDFWDQSCNFRPKMPPFHICTYIRITCYLWQLNTLWCNLLLLLFYLDAVWYGIREQGIFRIKFCWSKCQFYLSHW